MKVLFLGGSSGQTPPIEYAIAKKYVTYLSDNRPDNPGHRLVDHSYPYSTLDAEAVRTIIRDNDIDLAVSYASDLGCNTIALLAPEFGWLYPDAESIRKFTDKEYFRTFLREERLQSIPYLVIEPTDFLNIEKKIADAELRLPVIVKPTDSSGSKGVSVVRSLEDLTPACERAATYSRSKRVILEKFLERIGEQVCGDGYYDGREVIFCGFGDGYHHEDFDEKVPYGESFPSTHAPQFLEKARQKLQRVLNLLPRFRGTFNFDIINVGGEPFLIEVTPRSGGNFLSQAIQIAYGVDLTAASVESQCRTDFQLPKGGLSGFAGCFVLHSRQYGKFVAVDIDPTIEPNIVRKYVTAKVGQFVSPFVGGDQSLGVILLRFASRKEMILKMKNINHLIRVRTEAA